MNLNKDSYSVVLTPHFEINENMTTEEINEINRLNEDIMFDYISSYSITSTSDITTYPTVNGDTIADHMVRKPLSISISGIYSLFGNKPSSFIGESDRLTNVETFFERIQNEGIKCDIVMMKNDNSNNKQQRFIARQNMVLNSITWTESQTSLSFDFSFTEALSIEVDIPILNYEDENLPSITDATQGSFTEDFLNYEDIVKIVNNKLIDLNLMDSIFLLNFAILSEGVVTVGIIVGQAIWSAIIAGAIAVTGGLVAIIIGVIVAVAAFIIFIFNSRAQQLKRRIEKFRVFEDDMKNKQEQERYVNYLSDIMKNLEYLNDAIKLYKVPSNEEQKMLLMVDDDYFTFTFTKNNTQTSSTKIVWSLHIENVDGSIAVDIPDISSKALYNINDASKNAAIFKTNNSNYYVYLFQTEQYSMAMNQETATAKTNVSKDNELSYDITKLDTEIQNKIQESLNNVSTYYILVSSIDIKEDFANKLEDIIWNAMVS